MITITVTRKPLSEGTVAANVLKQGCGALNIDRSRVSTSPTDLADMQGRSGASTENKVCGGSIGLPHMWNPKAEGRWPANLIHNGSSSVEEMFPDTGKSTGGRTVKRSGGGNVGSGKASEAAWTREDPGYGDTGSTARFFKKVGGV
jgi:hypothetical protein